MVSKQAEDHEELGLVISRTGQNWEITVNWKELQRIGLDNLERLGSSTFYLRRRHKKNNNNNNNNKSAWPINVMWTSRHSLYSIRFSVCNECNSRRPDVTRSRGFTSNTNVILPEPNHRRSRGCIGCTWTPPQGGEKNWAKFTGKSCKCTTRHRVHPPPEAEQEFNFLMKSRSGRWERLLR